ncbi:MAG: acyltransferase, partial [Bacteroidales bacterium]|nr:acyltransferase [Bacteroidales bacterium]
MQRNTIRQWISAGFNYQRSTRKRFGYSLTTYCGRIHSFLAGVQLGNNVCFYGKPFIQKARTGKIVIGDHCSFRSNASSNLIGINRPCIISADADAILIIGERCGFSGTVIGCFKHIIIEDNVRCGANTLITDGDWHSDDPRSGPPRAIYIGKNVWLGVNSTVLKGVSIGENSVIGASSVVTKDIPSNVIAAGNPCKVIKALNSYG